MTRAFHADQQGAATVEWVMLLVAFGLPMMILFRILLGIMAEHYGMISFLENMPLP